MKVKIPFNAAVGIAVEVLYIGMIMISAFLLCLLISLRR
jgi:hypothetical protein